MDLKTLIKKQAQKLFGTERRFCLKHNYSSNDFNSKKTTMQNKFNDLKEFLEPLGLVVTINEVNDISLSTDEIKEVRNLIAKNATY